MAVVKFSRFTADHICSIIVEYLRMSFDFLLIKRAAKEINFRMNAAEDLGCVIPHRLSCILYPECRNEFLKQVQDRPAAAKVEDVMNRG